MSLFDLITCSDDDLVFGVPASSEWLQLISSRCKLLEV